MIIISSAQYTNCHFILACCYCMSVFFLSVFYFFFMDLESEINAFVRSLVRSLWYFSPCVFLQESIQLFGANCSYLCYLMSIFAYCNFFSHIL